MPFEPHSICTGSLRVIVKKAGNWAVTLKGIVNLRADKHMKDVLPANIVKVHSD